MNRRIGILGLLIIAMLSLCVINVTAASTSRPTMVTHNGYATQGTEPTKMVLGIASPGGSLSHSITVEVGGKYDVVGMLAVKNTVVGIGGATINFQISGNQQTWSPLTSVTTISEGKYIGMFGVFGIKASTPCHVYFRAIYDGDSQYAPTVSNAVELTVTQ
jgi:hypothetical protein